MADNINLATFQFDTAKLEQSLSSLQDKFFALKKEQEGYANQQKLSQKTIDELTKANLKLALSGKELSDEYKENEANIKTLVDLQGQQFKNQQNTINQMTRVRAEITQTNNQLKSYMDSEGQQNSLIELGNQALQSQVNNINQARASNTELLRVRNQLNPAIEQESKLITEINAKLDKNNAFIKENASAYEKQKIGIGSYTESIKEALKDSGLMNTALQKLGPAGEVAQIGFRLTKSAIDSVKDSFKGVTNSVATYKESQQQYVQLTTVATEATEKAKQAQESATQIGFKFAQGKATEAEATAASAAALRANATATEAQAAATAGATAVTNASSVALKLFRIALISTGIGAIVVLLGSLVAYLSSTQAGIDAVTSVTRPLQAIFQSILGVLQNLGERFVKTFSDPKKAIADLGEFVKQNLINRFTAFGEIIEGIMDLDFKKVTNGAAQAVTGVENMSDKIAGAAQATGKFLADAAKKGAEIDRLTKDIEKSQLAYNRQIIATNDLIDEQQLKSKDTSLTFAEREKAAREIIRLTEELGAQEAAIIEKKIQALKIQQSLNDTSREGVQEMIDLETQLDAARDRGIEAQKEQMRVIAGARKEAAQQALEAAKKESDARIKAMETELDIFIAQQGDKKRSMQEQLEIDKQIRDQSIAIAKEEYDQKIKLAGSDGAAKLQAARELKLAEIEINNEFLGKQTEAAIENANLELELFKLKNQSKLEANQFFSDELYQQELDRIARIDAKERETLALSLENQKISRQEYDLAIAQLDADNQANRDEADKQRAEAKKAQEAADILIQDELNAERFEYDLKLQGERFDRESAQRREKAIQEGADMAAFEQAEAKRRMEIESLVQSNKLNAAASTFGSLAKLAGEQSKAGKAFAIAQTLIDTYQSATAAYKAMSGIPVVGPALGVVAAAAAVKSGLNTVKQITSVKEPSAPKTPSYARGVIGVGTGTSDSIEANLSAGETVLTARAAQMFPREIAAINQASGGVGLNGLQGSSSLMAQESLRQSVDTQINVNAIAEAVYAASLAGTMKGSAKGIVDLTDNRNIMASAKF